MRFKNIKDSYKMKVVYNNDTGEIEKTLDSDTHKYVIKGLDKTVTDKAGEYISDIKDTNEIISYLADAIKYAELYQKFISGDYLPSDYIDFLLASGSLTEEERDIINRKYIGLKIDQFEDFAEETTENAEEEVPVAGNVYSINTKVNDAQKEVIEKIQAILERDKDRILKEAKAKKVTKPKNDAEAKQRAIDEESHYEVEEEGKIAFL